MQKSNSLYSILLFLILTSCNRNVDDSQQAAQEYCDCLKKNEKYHNNLLSHNLCDAELVSKYYYFHVFSIDNRYIPDQISKATKDSARQFEEDFERYLRQNCDYKPDTTNHASERPIFE